MRGAGPIQWNGETVYGYVTVGRGATRVRVSLDEADGLRAVEGARAAVVLPGMEPLDGLVVRVRREPPFAWIELTALAPAAVNRAG